jgi:ribosome-associated protein
LIVLEKDLNPSIELSTSKINDLIINSIQETKGNGITKLDLTQLDDSPTDYFIICHGNSDTQVKAIANNIVKEIKEKTGQLPNHVEGQQGGSWVLVDYFTTVVHIFYKDKRKFYNLEALWSDAISTQYESL